VLAHHEVVDAGAGVQLLGEHPDDHRSAGHPAGVDRRVPGALVMRGRQQSCGGGAELVQ
jgi:hypothetical protein